VAENGIPISKAYLRQTWHAWLIL